MEHSGPKVAAGTARLLRTLMSQLFEVVGGRITRIVLIFDTRDLTRGAE